jgi:Entner-Doudoroff aldolase
VTFRTDAAEAALREFGKKFPELFLGAGTILRTEQAEAAVDAGARFILSPGFNPKTVEYCLNEGIQIYPGVCTPSEMEVALGYGLTELKFFPAEAMGGIRYLKAVTGPLSMIRFIPTGGVNPGNLGDYLAFKGTLACAGSWIAPHRLVSTKLFETITENAASALKTVAEIRGGE